MQNNIWASCPICLWFRKLPAADICHGYSLYSLVRSYAPPLPML